MRIELMAAVLAGMVLGAAGAQANSVLVPYAGSFDEATVPTEDGLPAGDYDTIGGYNDVGLFHLVAGANTFTGSAHSPSDSSDVFAILIGSHETLTGASIVFGTNLNSGNSMFAFPGPSWTLEESSTTPTIFLQNLGFNGMDSPQSLTAPSFTRGPGLYVMTLLDLSGVFGSSAGPVGYVMTFNVTKSIVPATTPIPAALPLFASGLLGLGFMARRRKPANAGA